ncbi:hypothetical protein J7E97_30120 [Streptomyces sp. ISL-66]|uniref:hypothetical protein n=1 Tax=Streptomyces sp. ISL-66 TaxID=2819186 RepID=UPI001BE96626|nr:hypothetical protein [Streptomyces sp. ISL-66]MBT2472003.1 hypothetical protein [Streptomyces sp. ISL-66]
MPISQPVGTALWQRVVEELLADGRTSVSAEADLGGPGEAFARSLGFENVLPMGWYVQDVRRIRMLAEAAVRHPYLRRIDTSVADENTPMLAVNAALGYRRERAAGYFQLQLKL